MLAKELGGILFSELQQMCFLTLGKYLNFLLFSESLCSVNIGIIFFMVAITMGLSSSALIA